MLFRKFCKLTINHITLQFTGKEMCSLSKEDFLIRAPPYMGDILWAHLEILQKDVDRDRSGIELNNYPDSFNVAESFQQRTYTQLGTPLPPLQQHSSSSSPSMNAAGHLNGSCRQSQYHRNTGYPPLDYMHNNNNNAPGSTNGGSIVDSSSEYSYHALDIKYSTQMNNGRVPVYPPHHMAPGYPDSYGSEYLWPYSQMPQSDGWHQDFSISSTGGLTSLPPPQSTAAPPGMHHHPVFLQVYHSYY